MRIGQLAAQAGHSVRTIRFYEQSGLLPTPDRTSGGYRDYDQDAVTRLRFVRAEGEPLGLPYVRVSVGISRFAGELTRDPKRGA